MESRHRSDKRRVLRSILPVVAAITLPVVAGTLYLAWDSHRSEALVLDATVGREAEVIVGEIDHYFTARVAGLQSIRTLFLNSDEVTAGEFQGFGTAVAKGLPGFSSIRWLDNDLRVRHAVQFARSTLPAADVPPSVFETAAAKARETGHAAVTPVFDGRGDRQSVSIFLSLPPGNSEGLIEGRIDLADLKTVLMQVAPRDLWNMEIQESPGGAFYTQADAPSSSGWTDSTAPVVDRAWTLSISPTPLFADSVAMGAARRILIMGLAMTGIVAVTAFLLEQRQERLTKALAMSEELTETVEGMRVRLSNLVNGVEAVVWEGRRSPLRFTFVSQYAEKLLGFPTQRWIEEPSFWRDRLHPDDRERITAAYDSAEHGTGDQPLEYRLIAHDERVVWVKDIVSVAAGPETAATARGVIVDMTERLQADEALRQSQKLESLGVLAGGIAHDLNNLLAVIMGNAELSARNLDAGSPARTHLSAIVITCQRLAELTGQILAYAGKGRFIITELNLNDVISEMGSLLSVSTPKAIELTYDLHNPLPSIEGDTSQIRQVVLNLITNAVEAIGEHEGRVSVRSAVRHLDEPVNMNATPGVVLPPGDYVSLEVTDSGCGIEPETLRRIFDPFFTTKFTGRGLGLAALQGIVRGHKGGIEIRSRVGRGTRFRIYFPAKAGPAAAARVEKSVDASAFAEGKILVIDDEEALRLVMEIALAEAGFEVLTAGDGGEGLAIFSAPGADISLVILDLMMPVLGGEETFRRISNLQPDTPVLLISGFSEQEAVKKFAGSGLAGFLQKPFLPSTLIEKVRRILTARRSSHIAAISP